MNNGLSDTIHQYGNGRLHRQRLAPNNGLYKLQRFGDPTAAEPEVRPVPAAQIRNASSPERNVRVAFPLLSHMSYN